jgi:hypothetical protein
MFTKNKISNIIYVMSVVILSFLLSGCTYKSTVAIDSNIKNKSFKGLNNIFLESEDIVIYHIHGMGNHTSSEKDIVSFYNKIAEKLDFKILSNDGFLLEKDNYYYGNISIFKYRNKNSRQIKVISLSWSDITLPKELDLSNDSNPYKNRIAYINKGMKKFMNEGFGDAILYLNPIYKKTVHTSIQLGIEKACIEDEKLCNPKNVIVSSSLGSKMLFDVLDENLEMKSTKYKEFFPKIEQVFMTSNQIPLLNLVNTDLYLKNKDDDKYLKISNNTNNISVNTLSQINGNKVLTEIQDTVNKYNSNKRLSIITFSDPNDALSYYLPLTDEPSEKIIFTNVTLSYANWWLLGVLANPMLAHGGFMKSDLGIDVMINGSDNLNLKEYERN